MSESKKTPEIEEEICKRISEGEPLRSICRDDHMPAWRTFYDWVRDDEDLSARIAHARELGYEAIAEDTLGIADDCTNDYMERNGGDTPGYATNGEAIQRSKLRIETRLKLLSKWSPKKYGDRIQQEITSVSIVMAAELSDEELAKIAKGGAK